MSARLRIVLRRPREPHSPFVVGSALVHLALAGLLVFFPSFGKDRRIPDDFIVVTPVAGVPGEPGEPEAPPQPEAEAPQPEPEPEGARVEETVPEVVEKPKKKEEKKKKESENERETKPAPRPERPAATATGAGTPGGEGGRPGTDIASVGLDDLEYAWYRDQVIAALRSRWRKPVLDGVREAVSVTISFRIARDGSVSDVAIDRPSGIPSLDRSALRAVIEASPLPPLPPQWDEPVLPAGFVFRWYPGE